MRGSVRLGGRRAAGARRVRRRSGIPGPRMGRAWPGRAVDRARSRPAAGRAAPCRRSRFGREDRRTTGSRALPNEPTPTWVEFYASNRLLPLAKLAADAGALPSASIERLEALAGRLDVRGWTTGATGPPPRRPVGRQPTRRTGWKKLVDRPRCPRRAPRVRPGDDAPLRRLRRRLLRRLCRRVPARRRLGGSHRPPPDRPTRRARHQVRRRLRPRRAAAIDRYR